MNSWYQCLGLSKQAFHQRLNRWLRRQEEMEQLLPLIRQIRADHPTMSSRVIYHKIQPRYMGRDIFEALCREHGFNVEIRRNLARTTNSLGVTRFDNLVADLEVTHVNQVWVSDITYYFLSNRFYYITFMLDLYSRYIVGYNLSKGLMTIETTIPALNMALDLNWDICTQGLILHSDGGGQYYSKDLLAITREKHILNSMGKEAYDNAYAERLNGTIKNDYLIHYQPSTYDELKAMLKKAVSNYNNGRPHQSLKMQTPATFGNWKARNPQMAQL
jgi:putative transposase